MEARDRPIAIYSFICGSSDHPEGSDRNFDTVIHHIPKKVVQQTKCPECGGLAKRNMAAEIPTQSVVGLTPISHSTTVGGSMAKEIEFMAGRFKQNPDGTVDRNHTPFRDSGELNKFMNGANDLGEPVINQSTGAPMRRKDGSIVRRGAKLFKYGPNATPSRDGTKRYRPTVPDAWTDEAGARDAVGRTSYEPIAHAPRHRNPNRGAV